MKLPNTLPGRASPCCPFNYIWAACGCKLTIRARPACFGECLGWASLP